MDAIETRPLSFHPDQHVPGVTKMNTYEVDILLKFLGNDLDEFVIEVLEARINRQVRVHDYSIFLFLDEFSAKFCEPNDGRTDEPGRSDDRKNRVEVVIV